MKYALLLAVTVQGIDTWTVATVPETYKANVIEMAGGAAFSALAEATGDKVTFTVTQEKNRWAAIGFTKTMNDAGDKASMKGDFVLVKSQDNDDNFDLKDFNGDQDMKPSREDDDNKRSTIQELGKANADIGGKRIKSIEFTRAIPGDDQDATLACAEDGDYMEYNWFVRDN